jgi:hypothetical protein
MRGQRRAILGQGLDAHHAAHAVGRAHAAHEDDGDGIRPVVRHASFA